jgi:hypothetical protein
MSLRAAPSLMDSASWETRYRVLRDDGLGTILHVTGTTNDKSTAKIARTHLVITELLRFH